MTREREAFWQTIVDDIDLGIVATDAGGRVTFVNRRAMEILGRPGPFADEDVRELLDLKGTPDVLQSIFPERRWTQSVRVGDREVELDLTLRCVAETGDGGPGFNFIFRDQSAERDDQVERRRFEHLAAMGTMVAGFAHEVRNPMASLRSIAESLQEELAEAHLDLPHVARMLNVLERVERLVRTSLLFGRPSPPRRAAHRPWVLLSSALSAIHPRIRALGGELAVDADLDLPDVFVDEGQIVQALVILLNNALDATDVPSRVHLRARHGRAASEVGSRKSDPAPGATLRFEVQDDGPGIRPDILARIFDPFFTTKASGTGLGLSIAQQLVIENGGHIEVVSVPGGLTTFSLAVPVVDPASAR